MWSTMAITLIPPYLFVLKKDLGSWSLILPLARKHCKMTYHHLPTPWSVQLKLPFHLIHDLRLHAANFSHQDLGWVKMPTPGWPCGKWLFHRTRTVYQKVSESWKKSRYLKHTSTLLYSIIMYYMHAAKENIDVAIRFRFNAPKTQGNLASWEHFPPEDCLHCTPPEFTWNDKSIDWIWFKTVNWTAVSSRNSRHCGKLACDFKYTWEHAPLASTFHDLTWQLNPVAPVSSDQNVQGLCRTAQPQAAAEEFVGIQSPIIIQIQDLPNLELYSS